MLTGQTRVTWPSPEPRSALPNPYRQKVRKGEFPQKKPGCCYDKKGKQMLSRKNNPTRVHHLSTQHSTRLSSQVVILKMLPLIPLDTNSFTSAQRKMVQSQLLLGLAPGQGSLSDVCTLWSGLGVSPHGHTTCS